MTRAFLSPRVASVLLLSITAAATPVTAFAQNWTGFYYGLNVGAGQDTVTWSNMAVPSEPGSSVPGKVFTASQGGIEGGAEVGYNRQLGIWVWGAELALDGADMSASDRCVVGFAGLATCGARTDWALDFTTRIGGTVGPALLYVKGGGELSDQLTYVHDVTVGTTDRGSYKATESKPIGYVMGVGAEVAFTDTMSGEIEYDYSSVDYTARMVPSAALAADSAGPPFSVDVNHQTNAVTARLNFKLE